MLFWITFAALELAATVFVGVRFYSRLPSLRNGAIERKLAIYISLMFSVLILTAKLWSLHGLAHATIMYGIFFTLVASWLFEQPVATNQ